MVKCNFKKENRLGLKSIIDICLLKGNIQLNYCDGDKCIFQEQIKGLEKLLNEVKK